MYAIKIINNGYTYFHLADEISYNYVNCNGSEEFYSNMDNGENVFILGEVGEGDFTYIKMNLELTFKGNEYKTFYIMPTAWIYIMQEGKTIEAINIHELKQSVEV